ncbi:MAG: glycosyltransferase family 4 protein [Vulcanimicrobiaceae bacterium]
MKIAYLTVRFPYGPYETFFASEVRELISLKHEVVVIPTRPQAASIDDAGFAAGAVRLPLFGARTLFLALATVLRQPIRALRIVGNVVSARHELRAKIKNVAVLPKAFAVAWEVRVRKIEHIHALWLSTPATVAYVVSELTGIPWSCSAHRFDVSTDNLLHHKLASARFVRAISESARQFLAERAGMDVRERCHVVYIGVTVPPNPHGPRAARALRLLCPAPLEPREGHAYLLAALSNLQGRGIAFQCDLAGDGSLAADLHRAVESLGLGAVVSLCGDIPHDILLSRMEHGFYDLVVRGAVDSPDSPDEGIPETLVQAMALGIPCVATRTGAVPELIADSLRSLLVPQRDAVALSAAIAEFALYPQRRIDVGRLARRRICDAFDVRSTTVRLCELMGA